MLNLEERLLYRDGLILVIDKPAGIPVHAGPKGGENLEQYLHQLCFGLPRLPHLAHRLDRDTSGCLVLGRHRKALRKMGTLFAQGKVKKTYWALVQGAPAEANGTLDLPLKKRNEKRGWWMEVAEDGQPSVTEYQVLGQGDGYSWVEFRPHTGRTHQIRVHAKALGCPLVGDPVYGDASRDPAPNLPMQLHARSLVIPLSGHKPPIQVSAPVPAHMLTLLEKAGYGDPVPE